MGNHCLFFKRHMVFGRISFLLGYVILQSSMFSAYAVEFNTDMLGISDKENIDFSRFSQANYILPGKYNLLVKVNSQGIKEYEILFQPALDKSENSIPCITQCYSIKTEF